MNNKQKTLSDLKGHYTARAKIFKALGHPTRLFIVDRLNEKEHCVCELTEMIGADMSTVSKHLSVLKNADIVTDDKRGLQVWYSLKVPCIHNFFGCIEETIKVNAQIQAEELSGPGNG